MRYFLVVASLLFFVACSSEPDPTEQVNNLADQYVEAYFTTFPEEAAMLGAPDMHPASFFFKLGIGDASRAPRRTMIPVEGLRSGSKSCVPVTWGPRAARIPYS